MNSITFRRYYNGAEYHNNDPDRRLTKKKAQQVANGYRKFGYNARIARMEDGWYVYKSVGYRKEK